MRWDRVLLLALGLALVVGLLVTGVRAFFFAPACRVTVGETTVQLDSDQADAAARAVVRRASVASVAETADLERGDARLVLRALTGRVKHALSCTSGGGDATDDELSERGLTARAERVRTVLLRDFPDDPLGGFAPGGVRQGHMKGSAHYEGRAIDAFVRPISRANKVRGWALAHYLVARAESLQIETVIFDGWIWTHSRGGEGWRPYVIDLSKTPDRYHPTLMHRDHVHVDVPG